MHITDKLNMGGLERVAVNLINLLRRDLYLPYLCSTRHRGPLAQLLRQDVTYLWLERRHRYDVSAVKRLIAFIRTHNIRLLHAHGTSLFISSLVSLFPPHPRVIWHDHYGSYAVEERPAWLYRLAVRRTSGVIAVNQPLVEWSQRKLRVPGRLVSYIPNFVCPSEMYDEPPLLPGRPEQRIVCIAQLRPQKDHLTLLRAMPLITRQIPAAHLLVVGSTSDSAYLNQIKQEINQQGLERNVTFLGERQDVSGILAQSTIGVLSSASEGFPLVLLEYGIAGLPTVATNVGQCSEVLDEGRAGILVPPGAPDRLAEALLALLQSSELRSTYGKLLHSRVQEVYSPGPIMERIYQVYETALSLKMAYPRIAMG
jgi:glycosyltransferase involved in cell wall biosynthesis